MNSKSIFLKDDLAKWWVGIARDVQFYKVLIHARAEMMEMRPTQEQLNGAELILSVLLTLPDGEETSPSYPTPGLVHKFPDTRQPQTDQPKS